ncbi:tyrosine-type recombinase/integrase [Streptomyces sp. NPDC088354]|uniref:tyrosine-type recombinase/integrase n=1 Tax=Streptomyces sp. NPDC088354 TaxID=3365856 RepID=UPI0037FCBD8E
MLLGCGQGGGRVPRPPGLPRRPREYERRERAEWTPRELRHRFAAALSERGIPLEAIARVVGHSSTATTEAVYRMQLRPVITEGAGAMDEIFALGGEGEQETA